MVRIQDKDYNFLENDKFPQSLRKTTAWAKT